MPITSLMNPRIVGASKKRIGDWEGCLSVNDMRGQVPRADWVDVEAFNQKGERLKFHAEGFFARVLQHECDHLAGKVYLDRMPHLTTLSHLPEFVRFWQ
jgi:peptide deformylase